MILSSCVTLCIGHKTPYYRKVFISEEKLNIATNLETESVMVRSRIKCSSMCNMKFWCKTFCYNDPYNCLLTNRVVSYYFVDSVQENLVECMTSLILDYNRDVVAYYNSPGYDHQPPSVALDGFWCSGTEDRTLLYYHPNNFITLDLGSEHLLTSITFCVTLGSTLEIYFSNDLKSGDIGDYTNYELKATFEYRCEFILDVNPKAYVRFIGILQPIVENLGLEYIIIA